MSSKIRMLTTADLKKMLAIEQMVMNTPWSTSVMRDTFETAHTQTFGMDDDNKQLIAFGIISVIFDEAELLSMAVTPEDQRQGYGFALLKHAIKLAKKSKAKTLYVEVRQSNTNAINLYRKLDFSVCGIRKGYYPALDDREREDAVLMKLSLS